MVLTMNPEHDWWPCCYSVDIDEAEVKERAAKMLKVPEDAVEVKWTGGCWLARVRQEDG